MGQEQDKVNTEGELRNSRRKQIFGDSRPPSGPILSHEEEFMQEPAVNEPVPASPSYLLYKTESNASQKSRSVIVQSPVHNIENMFQQITYSQIPPADRYPTKISYFNAWSLPIQKYYLQQRGPYQAEQEVPVPERREMREMRQLNTGTLEQIMAEKMKEEMVMNQKSKRRQNLNMV